MSNIIIRNEGLTVNQAVQRYADMTEFIKNILKEGIDYGIIPGASTKPVLLKPGAEKLLSKFQLRPEFSIIEKVIDWEKGFFYFNYKCSLYEYIPINNDLVKCFVADFDGSANSKEKKWAYRWVEEHDLPPVIDKKQLKVKEIGKTMFEFLFAIEKRETTGQYGKPAEYWDMWNKAIKSGEAKLITKISKGKEYQGYELSTIKRLYRIPNDNIYDEVNTIMKIAEKRAMIGATLVGTGASDYFTQDLEDLYEDLMEVKAEYTVINNSVKHPESHKPQEIKPEDSTEPKSDKSGYSQKTKDFMNYLAELYKSKYPKATKKEVIDGAVKLLNKIGYPTIDDLNKEMDVIVDKIWENVKSNKNNLLKEV